MTKAMMLITLLALAACDDGVHAKKCDVLKIEKGMARAALLVACGEPSEINYSSGSWGIHEQWVYPYRTYVYVEDGKVKSLQFSGDSQGQK